MMLTWPEVGALALFVALLVLEAVWRSTGSPAWWEKLRGPAAIALAALGGAVFASRNDKDAPEPMETKEQEPNPALDAKPDTQSAHDIDDRVADAAIAELADATPAERATLDDDLAWLEDDP